MEKWFVTAKRADFKQIGETFSIDPVIARIIRNRDVIGDAQIEEYLHGGVEQLNDPHAMKDIDKAAALLEKKIKDKKKIRVIGDYDIDGIQSTYILKHALTRLGGRVDVAIPDRITDGYGLNQRLIEKAAEEGIDTILTCDNGIAACKEVELGKKLGMTVVITDHHEVPYEDTEQGRRFRLPPADAIVNPKQQDCNYPFPGLCGAGVAFKLVQVLLEDFGHSKEEWWEYLPYVAMATVGDVMDLIKENRILVKEGLKRLHRTENPGLLALIHQNQLVPQQIKAYHIGFILGPCLNASGRLDTAERALQLLCADNMEEAARLAKDLTDLNAGRKELTARGVEEADLLAQEAIAAGDKVLVLYLPQCHESLAGIIAGRIRERYNHPVLVLTRGEEGVKGSGRSIESYSMFEELSKVRSLFTKFGGHPMAAGVSLPEENVETLRENLNALSTLTEEDFVCKIHIDVPMPLSYITKDLVLQLQILEPFGKGNEKPVFADRNIAVKNARIMGKNRNVCKMQVQSSDGVLLDAVYFGDADSFYAFLESKKFEGLSFVYDPQINIFQGRESIQIVVKNYS